MNIVYKTMVFLKRIFTNTGPHGKCCGCKKFGIYYGLGCPNPKNRLQVKKINE